MAFMHFDSISSKELACERIRKYGVRVNHSLKFIWGCMSFETDTMAK